jgi:response regulator RpfG family c-di-GMP phosphodiesterase
MAAAAQWMAEHLRLEAVLRPDLDLAVHLHELGKIGLPPRLWRQLPSRLPRHDRETFRTFPVVTQVLMRHIEAFAGAAVVVRHASENWDGSGAPDHLARGRIPPGSRILRALADFFEDPERVAEAGSRQRVLEDMQEREGLVYDPAAFVALVQYVQHHLDASLAQNRRYVRVEDLRPGMRLAADLITSSGALLLRQNELLGAEEVRRIERHHAIDPFWFSIAVYPAGAR